MRNEQQHYVVCQYHLSSSRKHTFHPFAWLSQMSGALSTPASFVPTYAQAWRDKFKDFEDRKCLVVSPCVGIDAPKRAAHELGFSAWRSVDIYDLRPELKSLLVELNGSDEHVHVGAREGDLLRVELHKLCLQAEGLASGASNI